MELLSGYASSSSSNNGESDNDEISKKAKAAPSNVTVSGMASKMAFQRQYIQAAPQPSILANINNKRALLQQQQSSSSSNNNNISNALTIHSKQDTSIHSTSTSNSTNPSSSKLLLMNNPLKSTLLQPIQGPALSSDPNDAYNAHYSNSNTNNNNKLTGNLQSNVAFDETTFKEERNAFQRSGVALAPDEVGTRVERGEYGYQRRKRPNYGTYATNEDDDKGDKDGDIQQGEGDGVDDPDILEVKGDDDDDDDDDDDEEEGPKPLQEQSTLEPKPQNPKTPKPHDNVLN